jgi:hypothetical protein
MTDPKHEAKMLTTIESLTDSPKMGPRMPMVNKPGEINMENQKNIIYRQCLACASGWRRQTATYIHDAGRSPLVLGNALGAHLLDPELRVQPGLGGPELAEDTEALADLDYVQLALATLCGGIELILFNASVFFILKLARLFLCGRDLLFGHGRRGHRRAGGGSGFRCGRIGSAQQAGHKMRKYQSLKEEMVGFEEMLGAAAALVLYHAA